jgi:hypothetical protein
MSFGGGDRRDGVWCAAVCDKELQKDDAGSPLWLTEIGGSEKK